MAVTRQATHSTPIAAATPAGGAETGLRGFCGRLRTAVRDAWPIALGLAPLAFTAGATGAAAVGTPTAVFGSVLMYSGGAYFVMVSMLAQGAALPAVVMASIAANSRFVVYSAALSPKLSHHPWIVRAIASYFLAEPVFAHLDQRPLDGDQRTVRMYVLGLGAAVWTTWQVAFVVGAAAGPAVVEQVPTAFLVATLFVGLLVPGLRTIPAVAAAVAGAAVIGLAGGEMGSLSLVAAATVGLLLGSAIERSGS